ncbi:MAG: hypothetical protein WBG41_11140 [Acidimicrobiales bacterium]
MILIWMILAIVLLVIVLGGFVGRARGRRSSEDERREAATHPHHPGPSHHGRGAKRGRGRRGHDR